MPSINKIVIVGGGSAGWMTSATLKHHFPEKDIITIESPDIPTVGVGESTIGQINAWLHDLDIKDDDWMPHCDASYKISIKFTDFYKENSGGFHYPFGQPHLDGTIFGINDWYFKKAKFPDTPNYDYAKTYYPAVALSEQNKIIRNDNGELPTWRFDNDTAYHFDAAKFGLWLREQYCKPRGVIHIPAEVVKFNSDDSGITSLELSNGDIITADLYIDCTGFKALLIDKTLKVPFNKLSHILPNDSAWATRIPYQNKETELEPYTNCTAIGNGWVWNIPLWSRVGTGYVYSSEFISDEDALAEFKTYLLNHREVKIPQEMLDTLEFRNIKMRVGLHDQIYYKNVCAIGLAAGFIEPLESNGLFTAHEFLQKLSRTIRRESISQWDKDAFNNTVKKDFYSFAQFVSLHYALSQRSDTPYWKAVGERSFMQPSGIADVDSKYEDFVFKRMHKQAYDFELGGMNCISPGMGFFPIDESVIKRSIFLNRHYSLLEMMEGVYKVWDENQKNWKIVADNAPTVYEFLKNNYYPDE